MWRVIPLESRDAVTNLATDEAIMESVGSGGQPTIRFYTWTSPVVSIGFFQRLNDVKEDNVVRRQTGGGSIHHDPSEISYSIAAREKVFPKDIQQSYEMICKYVVDSLKILGMNPQFQPLNNVMVDDKIICTSAQTRRGGVVMQHGTLFCKESDSKELTSIMDFGNFDMQTVYHAMVKGFTSDKKFVFGHKTNEETELMKELIHSKYGTQEWLARR